jgi:dolichyl-phosphate beta-glucosyltransferase
MLPVSSEPYLSVIIPAYNEQSRIADTLFEVKEYLSKQPYSSEIIVVDDGSDDLTTEIVKFIDIYGKEVSEQDEGVLIENVKNVGKGYSIARGMLQASGEIVLFSDADLSTPIAEAAKLLSFFEQGYDVVIGSREMENSVIEAKPWHRKLMSGVFNTIVHMVSIPDIRDTQCGFKAYRRKVAHSIALQQRINGFAFDVEHLYIAKKSGHRIKEVGVKWQHKGGSSLSPVNSSLSMLRDLLLIRWFHRSL